MIKKRGQVTLFVIIGVVILLLVGGGLYFISLGSRKAGSEESNIKSIPPTFEGINKYIVSCLSRASDKYIKEISDGGGTLNQAEARIYFGESYNYLCRYKTNLGCINKFITRDSMENELANAIKREMQKCTLEPFRKKGIVINDASMNVLPTIGTEDVSVVLEYPISATIGEQRKEFSSFLYKSRLRLGKLYDFAVRILNDEIKDNFFDEDEWMRAYSEIRIRKHKPYPDSVYKLNIDYGDAVHNLTFKFAVGGKDYASNISLSLKKDEVHQVCYIKRDKNCYFNVERADCESAGGEYSSQNKFECTGISNYKGWLDEKDCGEHKHGDSWCVYDGIAGNGFDPVGSRHFKQSCFNGVIYNTECADYRGEICTEPQEGMAVCRANRWQDCTLQTNQADCENKDIRDCYWVDYLKKSSPYRTVNYDYSGRKCIPYVPPGLKFWEGNGEEVCRLANEQNDCKDVHCAKTWVESTALYCYFMGDCGNYFNYNKELSFGGFSNTDGKPRNYVYAVPVMQSGEYTLKLPNSIEQSLTGGEFEFLQGEPNYMSTKIVEWKKRMDSAEHVFITILPPSVKTDIDTIHSAYCSLWKAPLSNVKCSDCGKEPEKPCSEYRCKSISSNCIYSEANGIGKCGYARFDESKANISIEAVYVINEDINPSTALNDANSIRFYEYVKDKPSLTPDYFMDWRGYDIGEIEPYSKMVLVVKAGIPINCKISDMPNVDFNSIGNAASSYSKRVSMLIDAKSVIQEKEDSAVGKKMGSQLQIFNIGKDIGKQISDAVLQLEAMNSTDESMAQINELIKSLGSEMGGSYENASDALAKSKEELEKELKPFLEIYKETNIDYVSAMEANMAYQFIECSDTNMNMRERLFVSYSLLEDTKKPVLVEEKPERNSEVELGFKLELGFNEPVECRYSLSDKGFNEMKELACERVSRNALYYCSGEIEADGGNIYFKCRDQPVNAERYYLNLMRGAENNISGGNAFLSKGAVIEPAGIELANDKLKITNPDALTRDREIFSVFDKITASLDFSKEKICTSGGQALSCVKVNSTYTCSAEFGIGKYEILCQNDIIGNRNEASFVLEYS
jgi:hypothetical protein